MSQREKAPVVTRLLLGVVGVAFIGYGVARIFQFSAATQPSHLFVWLAGAVILHDGVLSIGLIGLGWWLTQFIPGRARAYLQGGLITGGLVLAIGVILVYRRGKSAPGQTLLVQNYALHLALILLAITAVTAAAYAVRVARDARRTAANERPASAHTSDTAQPDVPA